MKYIKTIELKMILILVLSVFILVIYTSTIPIESNQFNSYTLNFISMIYTFITICDIIIIDFKFLSNKDYFVALCLGLLSISAVIPIDLLSILVFICTILTYLAGLTLSSKYHNKMHMLRSRELSYIVDTLRIVFLIGVFWFIAKWISTILEGNTITLNYSLVSVFQILAVSISEEIIFRFFVFSMILHICEGENPPKLIAYLIMAFPFSIFHYVDLASSFGLLYVLENSVIVFINAIVLTAIAWKRDIFSAVCVHFIIDIIAMLFH